MRLLNEIASSACGLFAMTVPSRNDDNARDGRGHDVSRMSEQRLSRALSAR
jgi:hypothetical protein